MTTIDLAAQAQTITVPDGSWVGNMGSAGVGAVLLFGSWYMAKHSILLYGEWVANRLQNVKFDWKSMMSLLFGFFGVTAVLGSTGVFGDFTRWLQDVITNLGDIAIFASIGMGAFCLIALIMVFRKSDDPVQDMRWGYGLAIMFPLGGGMFSEASIQAGNLLVEAMGGVPSV